MDTITAVWHSPHTVGNVCKQRLLRSSRRGVGHTLKANTVLVAKLQLPWGFSRQQTLWGWAVSLLAVLLPLVLWGASLAMPSIACAGTSTYADEVVLTNGDRLSGEVVSLSQGYLVFSTPYATSLRIDKRHVARLTTSSVVVVDLASGERLIGTITLGDDTVMIVHSQTLGDHQVLLTSIQQLWRDFLPEGQARVGATTLSPRTTGASTHDPIPSPGSGPSLSHVRGKGAASAPELTAQVATPRIEVTKPIGQKPEDAEDIRRLFLRESSVLLGPGQVELETGLRYQRTQSISTFEKARQRQLTFPVALRTGLLQRAEGFLTLPLVYAQQDITVQALRTSHDTFGIGDISSGLKYVLAQEGSRWPEFIATATVTAPTGSAPAADGVSTGAGHWALGGGLQLIRTLDPIVLFGGLGYTYRFGARHFYLDGQHDVEPGHTFDYNLGVGFAVNERISLSTQLSGSYQTEDTVDGKSMAGSSREPVLLRLGVTHRWTRQTYAEASVAYGLDSDAPDFILGLSLSHRFGK